MRDAPATERRRFALVWGAVAGVALLALPLVPSFARFVPACPLKTFTGIPCPGCGATRAAVALAQLDVSTAFGRYPLWSFVWLVAVVGGLAAGIGALRGRSMPRVAWRGWPVVAGILLLGNWLWNVATGV